MKFFLIFQDDFLFSKVASKQCNSHFKKRYKQEIYSPFYKVGQGNFFCEKMEVLL